MFGSIWGLMGAILGFMLNSVNAVNSVDLTEFAESTHAIEKNETLTNTGIYEHLCLKMTADKGVLVFAQRAFDKKRPRPSWDKVKDVFPAEAHYCPEHLCGLIINHRCLLFFKSSWRG
jgi:hypothetical protein